MPATTVTELITRAAAVADMHDNFVSNDEWLYWANVANKELAVKIAQLGVPYNQVDEVITLDGSDGYLITEPLAIVGVYFVKTDGTLKRLKAYSNIQMNTAGIVYNADPVQFQYKLNPTTGQISLKFYPTPISGSVIVKYIQHPYKLVLGTPGTGEASSVYYPLNWENFIILKMAQDALTKEETINPGLERKMSEIEMFIETSASNYLQTDLPVIRDLEKDSFDASWIWPI